MRNLHMLHAIKRGNGLKFVKRLGFGFRPFHFRGGGLRLSHMMNNLKVGSGAVMMDNALEYDQLRKKKGGKIKPLKFNF